MNKTTAMLKKVDKPHGIERVKPDTEQYILYNAIAIKFQDRKTNILGLSPWSTSGGTRNQTRHRAVWEAGNILYSPDCWLHKESIKKISELYI